MRQKLEFNKCVGITKSGELIMIDYFFNDSMHGKPFHGATGSRFVPVSQDQIDERNTVEYLKDCFDGEYLWQEAVKAGSTDLGLDDYLQTIVDSVQYDEGAFPFHDTSYIHHIPDEIRKMHFDGYETFECVGGGRMFPLDEEMLLILDQDLWNAIQMIEAEPYDLEMFHDVLGGELKLQNERVGA